MTNDTIVEYFKSLGWKVETIRGQDSMDYAVIRDYHIKAGSLAGKICDVAILRNNSIPYTPPPAIHTRPALVPMDMKIYRTQNSGVGPEWQYWSRVFTKTPTPQAYVAHMATIFGEVKL